MQVFLRILKETGIALVVLILVSLVVWLLFQKQLPFLGQEIPEPIEYAEINRADFDITGDIEDETNPTQTYEATISQLNGYELERYVSTGLPNPFSSNNAEPDVPTERVTISNNANGNNSLSGDRNVSDPSGVKSLE